MRISAAFIPESEFQLEKKKSKRELVFQYEVK